MDKIGNENGRIRRKSDWYVPLSLTATIITIISGLFGIYTKINELGDKANIKNQNIYDRLTKIETILDIHLKNGK